MLGSSAEPPGRKRSGHDHVSQRTAGTKPPLAASSPPSHGAQRGRDRDRLRCIGRRQGSARARRRDRREMPGPAARRPAGESGRCGRRSVRWRRSVTQETDLQPIALQQRPLGLLHCNVAGLRCYCAGPGSHAAVLPCAACPSMKVPRPCGGRRGGASGSGVCWRRCRMGRSGRRGLWRGISSGSIASLAQLRGELEACPAAAVAASVHCAERK